MGEPRGFDRVEEQLKEKLRLLLHEKGWTQRRLARKIGKHENLVSNAFKPGTHCAERTYSLIAKGLDRSYEEILESLGHGREPAAGPSAGPRDGAGAIVARYVLDQGLLIEEKARGFVGRRFVFEAIDRFLGGPDRPGAYFVLRGEPGIGKSSVAARLGGIPPGGRGGGSARRDDPVRRPLGRPRPVRRGRLPLPRGLGQRP